MRLVAIAALIIFCVSASVSADEAQVVNTFQSRGREYQVAFVQGAKPANSPWDEDLVMRWRSHEGKDWRIVSTVPGVRLEKAVKIEHKGIHDALVVSRPGGSAQFISVVEVRKEPPGLTVPLRDELDKGGFDCRFDSRRILTGLRFHYCAWHVAPDTGDRTGHVFTLRDIAWSTSTCTFRRGPVRIDDEAERKADLADLLLAIGAEPLLGVKTIHSADGNTIAIYRPAGILRGKTPRKMRSAHFVKAVIEVTSDWRKPSRIASIEPCACEKTSQ